MEPGREDVIIRSSYSDKCLHTCTHLREEEEEEEESSPECFLSLKGWGFALQASDRCFSMQLCVSRGGGWGLQAPW